MNSDQSKKPNAQDSQPSPLDETRFGHTSETSLGDDVDMSLGDDVDMSLGFELAQPSDDTSKLKQLGKYELQKKLGVGGMGAVFLAFDPVIQREVAIKVLKPGLSKDRTALNRFIGEARAVGQLNHPNVISIYDIDEDKGHFFIVMELARGGDVYDLLHEQTCLPFDQACHIAIDAAKGLGAAHQAGMIHRDIKPENLMLTDDNSIKIVDFGLTKLVDHESEFAFTKTGELLGTPLYMSPEQIKGEEIDHRTDIYSLGATFYHLLTGIAPFTGDSVAQLVFKHVNSPRPEPHRTNPNVPPDCSAIIAKAMAIDPQQRYDSTDEMIADIEAQVARPHEAPVVLNHHVPQVHFNETKKLEMTALPAEAFSPAPLSDKVPKVLIAEPSKLAARVLADCFRKVGCEEITCVDSEPSALAHLETHRTDIIVTTRLLRQGGGESLLEQVRTSSSSADAMCVLMASDDPSVVADANQLAPPTAFVRKQSKPIKIIKAIRNCTDFDFPNRSLFAGDYGELEVVVLSPDELVPADLANGLHDCGVSNVHLVSLDDLSGRSLQEQPDLIFWIGSDDSNLIDAIGMTDDELANAPPSQLTIALIDQIESGCRLQGIKGPSQFSRCDRQLSEECINRLLQSVL